MAKKLFCLVGLDGAGKSTQARFLGEALAQSGQKSQYAWLRWDLFLLKPFHRAAKLLVLKAARVERTDFNAIVRTKRGIAGGNLGAAWLQLRYFDYLIKACVKLAVPLLLGKVVIADRYYYDAIVDVVSDFQLPPDAVPKLTRHAMLRRCPQPAIVFFLDIAPQDSLRRQSDIPSFEHLSRQRDVLLKLSEIYGWVQLDASADQMEIHDRILREVSASLRLNG